VLQLGQATGNLDGLAVQRDKCVASEDNWRNRRRSITAASACAEFGPVFERSVAPDIVLIDTAIPDGFAMVRRITQFAPEVRIVALALAEREDEVLAWVESGVSGYIPRSAAHETYVGQDYDAQPGNRTWSGLAVRGGDAP
jgi:DNA-binding NarL/FixJ family response regulator